MFCGSQMLSSSMRDFYTHCNEHNEIRATHVKVAKEDYKDRARGAKKLEAKANKATKAQASAGAGAK